MELSSTSAKRWCIAFSSVPPIYIPGRRRTGSRPSSTSMSAAVYVPSDEGAPFLLPPLADLDEGAGLLSSSSSLAKRSRDVADLRIASKKPEAEVRPKAASRSMASSFETLASLALRMRQNQHSVELTASSHA